MSNHEEKELDDIALNVETPNGTKPTRKRKKEKPFELLVSEAIKEMNIPEDESDAQVEKEIKAKEVIKDVIRTVRITSATTTSTRALVKWNLGISLCLFAVLILSGVILGYTVNQYNLLNGGTTQAISFTKHTNITTASISVDSWTRLNGNQIVVWVNRKTPSDIDTCNNCFPPNHPFEL